LVLDVGLTYRLLRALASLGFLKEESLDRFSLSSQGELLRKRSSTDITRHNTAGGRPEHYQIWKHLPSMVIDGQQDAFVREYGHSAFEYAKRYPEYENIFNQAMSSYSRMQTNWIIESLEKYDFSKIQYVCDIGGGRGHLVSKLLLKIPHLKGSILDLEYVMTNRELLWAGKIGVDNRCQYISRDMFTSVPPADLYMMKMILHDWNDEECIKILSNAHRASSNDGRIFIIEHLIPDPQTSHFSKLFDIHRMCWGSGRERTVKEYSALLERSGWNYLQTFIHQMV